MKKQITKVLRFYSGQYDIELVLPHHFRIEAEAKHQAQIELVFRPNDYCSEYITSEERVFDLTLSELELFESLIQEAKEEIKRTMTTQARIPFVGGA